MGFSCFGFEYQFQWFLAEKTTEYEDIYDVQLTTSESKPRGQHTHILTLRLLA